MTFEHAGAIPDGATLTADICIVGSGAAGLALVERLSPTARILVLEAGGLDPDETGDESFEIDCVGYPQNNTVESRGRRFGGSTDLWFGRIAALDPIDFETRPWVPHSGWPLSHDQLQPWLSTAASLLDVPNFDRIQIDEWEPNPTTEMVARGGEARLGVFLWADGMLMGKRRQGWIERSTNVRLVLEATATQLVPNESSTAIESLTVVGPHLNRFSVRATNFVLAAGGLENPRLLLASTTRSTAGVGNSSDNVGRYYMDHPRGEGLAGADLRELSLSGTRAVGAARREGSFTVRTDATEAHLPGVHAANREAPQSQSPRPSRVERAPRSGLRRPPPTVEPNEGSGCSVRFRTGRKPDAVCPRRSSPFAPCGSAGHPTGASNRTRRHRPDGAGARPSEPGDGRLSPD